MKHSQKGSTAVTAILVLVVVVIVAFALYLYMQNLQSARQVSSVPPVTETTQMPATDTATATPTTPADTTTPALPPHAGPNPLAKVYSDHLFGFATTYPQTMTLTTDKKGTITLAIPQSTIMPITIVKATGSADTSTGKWGKNVLSYGKNGWVTQVQDQNGTVQTVAAVPFASTPAGLPIFNGGTHHGFGLSVYVVALSHTKFLIITGGEGLTTSTGYDYATDPTLQIAKAITLI
jgi:hypothetical protein